jgi:hypothetical protein
MASLGRVPRLAFLGSEEDIRRALAECLIATEGKIIFAAHQMGHGRAHFYTLIHKYRLWPLVNRVRMERLERERMRKKHGISDRRAFESEE